MATERLLEANEMMVERFQPQQQHRFIMYVDGLPAWLIRSTNKPAVSINPVVVDYINIKRKYAGKPDWQSLNLRLNHAIVPSAAQAVMEWFRLQHETLTGRAGYADFYKKDLDLLGLGPVGDIVEKWKIYGAFITEASFGDLDWASDDVVQISITLAYDWAILEF